MARVPSSLSELAVIYFSTASVVIYRANYSNLFMLNSTAELFRIIRSMTHARSFASASRKYRPTGVRILFIAEAPPAFKSRRFFYFADLRQGDTLFLEMMKVLYPQDVGFSGNSFRNGFSSDAIRRRKSELLNRFKSDGYYLIDACERPMPRDATASLKAALVQKALSALKSKVSQLIDSETLGVLLIGVVTHHVCADALRGAGVTVLNKAAINHPARGGQVLFRAQLRAALNPLVNGFSVLL